MDESRPPACPECGSEDVIPVVHGRPTEELIQRWRRGEIELGGCCTRENPPAWHCRRCGNCWK